MFDANSYRITVQRLETEDGLFFEGSVHELPDITTYGESFGETYELVIDAINGLHELATKQGRSFPDPSTRETEYSGKFVIRMPKWLHRDLATVAADQGVSLNSYAVSALSAHNIQSVEMTEQVAEADPQMQNVWPTVSSAPPASNFGFWNSLLENSPAAEVKLIPAEGEHSSLFQLIEGQPKRRSVSEA